MTARINTPRPIDRKLKLRVGIHFMRYGFHLKTRRGDRYRHLCIKVQRASAFGKPKKRTHLWIGWWQSRKGVKKKLNGFRFVAALDRLPQSPPDTIPIPFYPQHHRSAERSKR